MRLLLRRLRLCLRAVRAVYRAHYRKPKPARPNKRKHREKMRRRAIRRLGGACACCGLGLEFARVLTFHHINQNGDLHRPVLSALSIGLVQWVLTRDDPGSGLFAVEVLCEVCHKMTHEAGRCPHRWRSRQAA